MENKRPGETSQRRPPVPRPPPRPRSYPPQPTQSRPYLPPPRAYPPPHITPQPPPARRPARTTTPQVRKAPQPSQGRKSPPASQGRLSPQASRGLQSPQASPQVRKPSRTATPRKVSATTIPRKAVVVPKPEPRFRDALWPAAPAAPAINRIALLCALLYAVIHILCGVLLVYPLNVLTARMPFPLADIARALLPALIGATLCALTRFPMKLENRVGLSAYRKLLRAVLTLLVAVTLLMWGEWAALRQVARFVLLFVLGPLAAGTGLSVLLFYFDWLYDLEEDEDA